MDGRLVAAKVGISPVVRKIPQMPGQADHSSRLDRPDQSKAGQGEVVAVGSTNGHNDAMSSRKRPRENEPNCGCNDTDVSVPLAKRIHSLNLQHVHQLCPQSYYHNNHHHPFTESRQEEPETNMFAEKYPYTPNTSPYYVPNHILFHAHQDRMARQRAKDASGSHSASPTHSTGPY